MSYKRITIVLLVLSLFGVAAALYFNKDHGVIVNKELDLTWSKKNSLVHAANKGDAKAAVRLSEYYNFIENNSEQSVKWLKLGAENGNDIAQYKLGKHYLYSGDSRERKRAIYWLAKAAQQGNKNAEMELSELMTHTP